MTRKASKFKVGLFVLVGVLLMVSGLIWLGASRYLKGSTTYATYFSESVQGLQMDSVVKYRGVEVGRVKAIRVAPDNTLIEVVMDIVFKGKVDQNMVASLKMVGITGIAYVELDQRRPGAADQSPAITFASEYPIIPSRPSEISQILTVAEEVVQQVRRIDFNKLADELEQTLVGARHLVAGAELKTTVANLDKAAANLASITGRVDRYLASGKPEAVTAEAKAAASEARLLLAELREKVRPLDLGKTQDEASQTLVELRRQTGALVAQAQSSLAQVSLDVVSAAEDLRRSATIMERLLERLDASPSDIIFSSPPAPRGPMVHPGPGR